MSYASLPPGCHIPFALGSTVYHMTDDSGQPGIVTGHVIRLRDVEILVTWSPGHELAHYPIELTDEFQPRFPSAN